MSIAVGMLFLVTGLAAVAAALPATHRLARVTPRWAFSRVDVECMASTTLLPAFVVLLGVVAGLALLLHAIVQP